MREVNNDEIDSIAGIALVPNVWCRLSAYILAETQTTHKLMTLTKSSQLFLILALIMVSVSGRLNLSTEQ